MSYTNSPGRGPQPLEKIQWIKFRNDSGEEIPAHGILRITGFNVTDEEEPFATVGKPNTYGSQCLHAINDQYVIGTGADDKYGLCCLGQMVPALYDDGDGTPAFGEMWGPRNATWKLKKDTGGFRVMGVANEDLGVVLVVPDPMLSIRGKPTGDVAAGSSGSLDIWTGPFGSESDTGETLAGIQNDSSCTVIGSEIATAVWVPDNQGWQFVIWKSS